MNNTVKILDRYITGKFIKTFFFAIGLIILIAIVFDISEKIDDFLEKDAPLHAIVFDYYMNFIPYFVNLFSPLFIFIAVIFFTSKMASQTEIVAILASGISFRRLLLPYMVVALGLGTLSFYLNGWIIPHANKTRIAFENTYIKNPYELKARNIHRQIRPGEFIYLESYNNIDKTGFRFTYEKIENGKLIYKLNADRILWDSTAGNWKMERYMVRTISGMKESVRSGASMDTLIHFYPSEFGQRSNFVETMDMGELNEYIEGKKLRGAEGLQFDLVEKYRRTAYPFAAVILTLIGVALSSRKVRGGIGLQIGLGILLSFTYIMFMQISTTFATNGNFPPLLAVWIPNLAFGIIAVFLIRTAPK
ncbi:MAG TPA: LptF/LptG family permease [Bacteroidia bacterium]|nr:LptF/LptG family permease [Bacteroidia bacterium]